MIGGGGRERQEDVDRPHTSGQGANTPALVPACLPSQMCKLLDNVILVYYRLIAFR